MDVLCAFVRNVKCLYQKLSIEETIISCVTCNV